MEDRLYSTGMKRSKEYRWEMEYIEKDQVKNGKDEQGIYKGRKVEKEEWKQIQRTNMSQRVMGQIEVKGKMS